MKQKEGHTHQQPFLLWDFERNPAQKSPFVFKICFLLFIVVSSLLTVLVSEDKENLLGRKNKVTELYWDDIYIYRERECIIKK